MLSVGTMRERKPGRAGCSGEEFKPIDDSVVVGVGVRVYADRSEIKALPIIRHPGAGCVHRDFSDAIVSCVGDIDRAVGGDAHAAGIGKTSRGADAVLISIASITGSRAHPLITQSADAILIGENDLL